MTPDTGQTHLSHVGPDGRAHMVDVGSKAVTQRFASAEAYVRISSVLAEHIRTNTLAKGNLIEVARLAGIQAAKRTPDLIPLCHSLPLDHADVQVSLVGNRLRIVAQASTNSRTGVEMEALTAAAVAALTVIDMGKSIDKSMVVEGLRILEKRGGKSGEYHAGALPP